MLGLILSIVLSIVFYILFLELTQILKESFLQRTASTTRCEKNKTHISLSFGEWKELRTHPFISELIIRRNYSNVNIFCSISLHVMYYLPFYHILMYIEDFSHFMKKYSFSWKNVFLFLFYTILFRQEKWLYDSKWEESFFFLIFFTRLYSIIVFYGNTFLWNYGNK